MKSKKILISAFTENFIIAFSSLKANRLRSILTILIIAIGIMALVGILTAIDAIESSLTNQFTTMGSNTFVIENWAIKKQGHRNKRETKLFEKIRYAEAINFKKKYNQSAIVSVSVQASGSAIVKYKNYKSNPNIPVVGSDENYLLTTGNELFLGRFISKNEALKGKHVVVIGKQISDLVFKKENPINKEITIGKGRYLVVGVLQTKGSNMSMGTDKMCILPIQNVRQYFSSPQMSYSINVIPEKKDSITQYMEEAEGVFRRIRNLSPKDANNFTIKKSDNLIKMMMQNIQYVTLAATIIGIITLLGATISLLNIMLISVKERTREIGTRKALGAKNYLIRQQFLIESILIGELGGLLGIALGIIIGNVVALIIGGPFVIPWVWMIAGVLICLIVGLLSGVVPAIQASKLDPIEALRYE